jgi:hypothetical protein
MNFGLPANGKRRFPWLTEKNVLLGRSEVSNGGQLKGIQRKLPMAA